jgi:predicted DNA-binding transcriptional regulator AlpA
MTVVDLDSRRQPAATAPAPAVIATNDRIMRMPEAVRRSGLSVSTIYRRCSSNEFAPKIPLGGKSVGFRESDFARWMAGRDAGGAI